MNQCGFCWKKVLVRLKQFAVGTNLNEGIESSRFSRRVNWVLDLPATVVMSGHSLSHTVSCKTPTDLHLICGHERLHVLVRHTQFYPCWLKRSFSDRHSVLCSAHRFGPDRNQNFPSEFTAQYDSSGSLIPASLITETTFNIVNCTRYHWSRSLNWNEFYMQHSLISSEMKNDSLYQTLT